MTNKQLTRLGKQWQHLLRLDDWHIKYEMVCKGDIGGAVGRCSTKDSYKIAEIAIANDFCYEPHDDMRELEETLVHELLEIHYTPFKYDWKKGTRHLYDAQERSLNMISMAMVALKYTKRGGQRGRRGKK